MLGHATAANLVGRNLREIKKSTLISLHSNACTEFVVRKEKAPIMTKSTRISIKEPCSENWEKMTPNEQGRFCQSCQKSVVDIQSWSDEKLLNFLAESKGQACLKASKQQLNRPLIQAPSTGLKWNAYIGGFLALFITSAVPAQSNYLAPTKVQSQRNGMVPVIQSKDSTDSVRNVIAGVVLDSLTKEPLSFCQVVLIAGDMNEMINGVVSDINGRFSLAYDGDTLTKLFLEISFVGYEKKRIAITDFQKSQNMEVVISESTMGMMGEYVVVQPKKPWWKFWK